MRLNHENPFTLTGQPLTFGGQGRTPADINDDGWKLLATVLIVAACLFSIGAGYGLWLLVCRVWQSLY